MPRDNESQKRRSRAETLRPVLKAEVATATGSYDKATEFVESSSGSSIYVFWNDSEEAIGEWTGPPTQVWRNFYNPGTNRVVTSTTGTTTRFTEY